MNKPKWLQVAENFKGLQEIVGPRHNPQIVDFWKQIGMGGIKDDETPWCFHPDAEIMTNAGWVSFRELHVSAFVAVVNDEGEISFSDQWAPVSSRPERAFRWGDAGLAFSGNHHWIRETGQTFTMDDLIKRGTRTPIRLAVASAPDREISQELSRKAAIALLLNVGRIRFKPRLRLIEGRFARREHADIAASIGMSFSHLSANNRHVMTMPVPDYAQLGKVPIEALADIGRHDAVFALEVGAELVGVSAKYIRTITSRLPEGEATVVWLAAMAGLQSFRRTAGRGRKSTRLSLSDRRMRFRPDAVRPIEVDEDYRCVLTQAGRIIVRHPGRGIPVVTGNCGAFVTYCLKLAGIKAPNSGRALDFASWGVPCGPVPGAVAVFARRGGGHVGFVTGVTPELDPVVLGGNQGNAVNERAFRERSTLRLVGYRWPRGLPVPATLAPVTAAADGRDVV